MTLSPNDTTRGAHRRAFWTEALAVRGSVTPHVAWRVVAFGMIAVAEWLAVEWLRRRYGVNATLAVAPYEIVGGVLGVVLVLRTNAGYDRWWEARRLWGGIVNASRNLAAGVVAYGPDDADWRECALRWIAALPHAARASLRGEREPLELTPLLGPADAARVGAADHMPLFVSVDLARQLHAVAERMDRFAFANLDRERNTLIDLVGGCERILRTPLPQLYAVKVRQFVVLYLLALPIGLLHELTPHWLVPIMTMMLAYPLLALDQIAVELQNPFSRRHLNHLPLDEICATIERNVLAAGGARRVAEA